VPAIRGDEPAGIDARRHLGTDAAVGKTTLTAALPIPADRPPVEARVTSERASGQRTDPVYAAARRGTSGSGGALPHRDRIQQLFGRHDVSGIRAHVGGAAAEAAHRIGAEAYAVGNDVAFRASPDLHTAAHEAAHVVQQRAGVHLAGGIGAAGDPFEQHADAVADAVVAGRSAEPLLDRVPAASKSADDPRVVSPPAIDQRSQVDPRTPIVHDAPSAPRPEHRVDGDAAQRSAGAVPDAFRATAHPPRADLVSHPPPSLHDAPPGRSPPTPSFAAPAPSRPAAELPGMASVVEHLAVAQPGGLRTGLMRAGAELARVRAEQTTALADLSAPSAPPHRDPPPPAPRIATPPTAGAPRPVPATEPHDAAHAQAAAARHAVAQQPVPVSAGPRPLVPLVGKSDPAQLRDVVADHLDDARLVARHTEAQLATSAQRPLAIPAAPDTPAMPRVARRPSVLPAPPRDDVPAFARDAVTSGRAPQVLQNAPPGLATRLTPGFLRAADAHLETTRHRELTAFRDQERQHNERADQVRTDSEARMQAGLTELHQHHHAARAQTLARIHRHQDDLRRSNADAQARLEQHAASQHAEAERVITDLADRHEHRAAQTLARGEGDAARIRAAAEAQAAALLASADHAGQAASSAPVQCQGGDTPPLHDDTLKKLRTEARQILDDAMRNAFTTLDKAQSDSSTDITNAAKQAVSDIATYRDKLNDYQLRISGQMALNAGVLQNEIKAAFSDYDKMMANYDPKHLTDEQAKTIAAWWKTNGPAQEQKMTDLMSKIDQQANMLEPMYAYGVQSQGTNQDYKNSDVQWTKVDMSFMAGATKSTANPAGFDAGSLYLPYHDDAHAKFKASGQFDELFPWEGMAAVVSNEQKQLHPAQPGLSAYEKQFYGDHWMPEAMGIFQTMLARTNLTPWGNFQVQSIKGMNGYQPYANPVQSGNAAALQNNGQYAKPQFLGEYGSCDPTNTNDPTCLSVNPVKARGIAEDYYALGAMMFFTGASVNQGYSDFADFDTDPKLNGGSGNNQPNSSGQGNDRAEFGRYSQGFPTYTPLQTTIHDPRADKPSIDYGMDVDPEDLGLSRVNNATAKVTAQGAGLRSGPGLNAAGYPDYPASMKLKPGQSVTIMYQQDNNPNSDWVFVSVGDPKEGGSQGWILRSLLEHP
jgi:hypothetical protein